MTTITLEAIKAEHTRLANLLRDRGHSVKSDMTKIYRTKETAR